MTLPPNFAAELATKYLALAERIKANRLVLIYVNINKIIADAEASGKPTATLAAHCHSATEALRRNDEAKYWIRSDKRSNDELLTEAEPKLGRWINLPSSSPNSPDSKAIEPKQQVSESA